MAADFINLDHNATTPPFSEVVRLVAEVMAEGGNPSAVHRLGRQASGRLETARRQVAGLCGARARDVTFFGSATEAQATLIHHFKDRYFLRPDTEHDAVLAARVSQTERARQTARAPQSQTARASLQSSLQDPLIVRGKAEGDDGGGQEQGQEQKEDHGQQDGHGPGVSLALRNDGHVDLERLAEHLHKTAQPILLAIMAANNETGLMSDLTGIAEVVAQARSRGAEVHYHVDAVQAPGKMAIDFGAWGCDSLALSAHKMGGPQGVGGLITRPGFDLTPLIRGGGQERRRRAGTENVAGIAGFGLACEMVQDLGRLTALRSDLEQGLKAQNPEAIIVGEQRLRLPNTSCVLTPGKSAETLLMHFDLAGIGLSSGSACSSGKVGSSHVLTAMGIGQGLARSALRFSLGRDTTAAHIDRAIEVYGAACR